MGKYFSSFTNLLKTMIGSGILTYPLLFRIYGIIPTILFSCIACTFSYIGLFLYIESTSFFERMNDHVTIGSLASSINHNAQIFTSFCIFFKCFGVSISYLIIIRQLLPIVFSRFFPGYEFLSAAFLLFLFILIISPLCYFEKIDKLKYTSLCGLLCILFMVLSTFYRFTKQQNQMQNVLFFGKLNLLWITGVGRFVFSFTCHQNIFTVRNELSITVNRPSFLKTIAFNVVGTAFFMYVLFGISSYILYGNDLTDNILLSYSNDNITNIVLSLYILVMGFSYPLQINPARLYLFETLSYMRGGLENPSLRRKEHNRALWAHILVTTLLIVSTYSIAASRIKLGSVYSFIGATASSIVCCIFPGLVYLKTPIVAKTRTNIMLSKMCIIYGVLVLLTSLSFLL